MRHVLTLIADPRSSALDEAVIARLRACLPRPAEPVWLAPGIAADIMFEPRGLLPARSDLEAARGEAPVDLVVQPEAGRRKRLLVADMDSTMIEQEGIDELADGLGLKPQIAAITERAMRGEIDFEPALRERVALLKGLERREVERIVETRVTLTQGARTLVRTMRAHGGYTALVSGGFTLFSEPVARRIGFDEHRANELVFEGSRLAGRVDEPILGREAKLQALIELRERFGLQREETMAVGDGANDLAMIGEAGLGVAFRAKPAVAQATAARIDHADLTALLYVQGFQSAEFVDD